MKRIISIILILVLTAVCSIALADTEYAMCKTPTKDGTVYIRAVAGAGQPVVGIANNGDTLMVLKRGNTWHKVRVMRTGIEGYIYGAYITFLGSSSSGGQSSSGSSSTSSSKYTADASVRDTDSVLNVYGTISSSDGYANLRWGPSTSFSVITRVYNSTQVHVLELNGSWYRCRLSDGKVGYISKKLVKTGSTVSYSSGLNGVIRSSDGYASIRCGAGTSYPALYSLNVGQSVTAYTSSGDWFKVTAPSSWSDAFVHKKLVRFCSAARTTGNVNLRKGPDKTYDIIRALPNGTAVTLLATDGNFCRVDTGKEIAFLSLKYLSY